MATTVETGSFTDGEEFGTETSTETIDLNTGQYTWVRTINWSFSICAASYVETQNRTATLPITLTPLTGPSLTIRSPVDGAKPRSQFVALTGIADPGETITISVDGIYLYTTSADSSGNWEQVVRTGAGAHTIQAQDGSVSSNIISVIASPPPTTPLVAPGPYTALRNADIILAHLVNSPQDFFYGPIYTHVALFIGGDGDGTPLIAEAVPKGDAGTLGQVRAVPIEQSTIYTEGSGIDLYRPVQGVSLQQRMAISSWVNGVANRGLIYWTPKDISTFAFALLYYEIHLPGLFNQEILKLDELKFDTDRFICSTLVWRAYYEGTGHEIDLSTPNYAVSDPVLGTPFGAPKAFIALLQPHFVFPDTISLSGKVTKVAQ
jgi:hypothetical protein